MKKCIALSTLSLFLTLSPSGLQAQQKTIPQEKHQVEVVLILVDVIATKDGEFVKDLAKEEFQLFEDGKKVSINSLELITLGEAKVEVAKKTQPPEIAMVPRKHLAVVFDGINTWERDIKTISQSAVGELISLVKLGHEVMILFLSKERGLDVVLPFSTDEKAIEKAVSLASGALWQNRMDELVESIMLGQYLQGTEPATSPPSDRDTQAFLRRAEESMKHSYLLSEKQRFEATVGGIFAAMNMVRSLPGRKSILFISNGLPDLSSFDTSKSILDMRGGRYGEYNISVREGLKREGLNAIHDKAFLAGKIRIFDPFNIMEKKEFKTGEQVIREMIRYANAQNISLYSLDAEIYSKYMALGQTAEHFSSEEAIYRDYVKEEKIRQIQNLRWISEDTGALAFRGANKFDTFRKALTTDLNYYYQLSYYPRRVEGDDKYHKIEVKVKRPGVDVRFRKGYTHYSEEEANKILVVSAFYNPAQFKDLPFEGDFIAFATDSGKYEPWMNIAVPAKEFFTDKLKAEGKRGFEIHFWFKDLKEAEKGYGGQVRTSFAVDSDFLAFLRSQENLYLRFKGPEMGFRPGEYRAIFAILDSETRRIGAWDKYLTLPEKDNQPALINCVLGAIEKSKEKRTEAFLLAENGILEYGQIKFKPSVTNRLSRQEGGHVFIQVYLPQGKNNIQSVFTITGQDRTPYLIKGELTAESWNSKTKIWSGLFFLDLSQGFIGGNILKLEIQDEKGSALMGKEIKVTIKNTAL